MCGSGADIIHDRLVFAATNFKPILQLRDVWAAAASDWQSQLNALTRAFERENEAVLAAHKRALEAADAPSSKRMRVQSAQIYKSKYPGSLTVSPGDTCVFIESATNPLWSHVKMDDDGRLGIISASRLVEIPAEADLEDPTDDEAAAAAEDEAHRDMEDERFMEATCSASTEGVAAPDGPPAIPPAAHAAAPAGPSAVRELHYLELGVWVRHTSGHHYTHYQGIEVIWWTGQGTGVSGVTNELVTFQQTSGLAA